MLMKVKGCLAMLDSARHWRVHAVPNDCLLLITTLYPWALSTFCASIAGMAMPIEAPITM